MKKPAIIGFIFAVALGTAMLWGCDTSCDTEGATECSGATLRVCTNKEWDDTDCFTDYCESSGYSSGSCVDAEGDTPAYCNCG
ncbi:MAG: hypothetical protein HY897_18795 [Deltaproteobacteria bacterium]|nr:hypothetical protein [Deltaproteobacteria bacterium]